ncbi:MULTISPECIES: hypothetical protein [unclassified Streptomyces]|uniref:hypothetical protein n=1 Tax=unclassified Streptomyces TaxID=2593676 RepID=UPI00131E3790|nr:MULTISPECIES: hypothetical protein [unclassified Streptomyces]
MNETDVYRDVRTGTTPRDPASRLRGGRRRPGHRQRHRPPAGRFPAEDGLTAPDLADAARRTRRAVLLAAPPRRRATRRAALLAAPPATAGQGTRARFGSFADIDPLVTDTGLAPADKAFIQAAGTEVVLA